MCNKMSRTRTKRRGQVTAFDKEKMKRNSCRLREGGVTIGRSNHSRHKLMAAVFSLLSVIVCPFHFDKKRLDDEKKKKCCWLQNCFPDGQTCTPGVCRQLHLNFLNLQGQQGKQSSRRRVFLRVYGKTCAGRVNLHTQGKIHEWLFCHTQQTLAYPCVSIMYSRNFSFSHSVFTCLLSPPISFAVIYTSSCCVSVHSFSQ